MTEEIQSGFLFVDLALADGRPFDGLAAGEFIDMYGRKVSFKPDELDEYAANTQAAIEATRSESGELVGLPIDTRNHDRGDAAGWIVGVEREGNKLRFTPKWTDLGLDLISRGIQRFFSATVNVVSKTVLGGTLTNWPATRDKTGKVLLRPIELSMPALLAVEESLNERIARIRRAFDAQFDVYEKPGYWVIDVFDDYVIVESEQKFYKVTFEDDGEEITFADANDWTEVKRSWVESAMSEVNNGEPGAAEISEDGEATMTTELTKEELQSLIAEQVKAVLGELTTPPAKNSGGDNDNPSDLLELFNLQGASEEVVAAIRETLLEQYDQIQQKAKREAAEMIANVRREANISEFCQKVTGGTEDAPRGLPVKSDELKNFLLSLNPDQLKFATGMLETIVKSGLVEYTELGHGKKTKGTQPLPAEIAARLDSGELKLADLSNPILAPILGDLEQYDLSKWEK